MPIYEFQCRNCRNQFESIVMSPAAIAELVCPNCQSKAIDKIISAGSIKSGKSLQHQAPASSGCGGGKSGFR